MAFHDENNGKVLIVIAWVFLAASSLIVALRFWVRHTRIRRIAIDDWLMLISLFCEYVHTIFICVAYTYGFGRHISALSESQRSHAIKWIFIIQFWAIVTSMFGRISFSSFLLQIVGPAERLQKVFLWGVIATQLLVTIPTLVQIYTQCGIHISALWDTSVAAHTHCLSPNVQTLIGYVQSAMNSACDLVLTVLPCFILWHLHLPFYTKLGLGAVLTLSIFALGASIVKAVEIRNLAAKNDFTWAFVTLTIWVCVENNVVIMAASIPTLRPIMKRPSSSATHESIGRGRITAPYDHIYNSADYQTPQASRRESKLAWLVGGGSGNEHSVHTASATGTGPDIKSDELMLQFIGDQHIAKTTDVSVAYESHDAGSSSQETKRTDV